MQGTGSVWEQCDAVTKLPADNKVAVLKMCITELRLLKDACEEVDKVRVFLRGPVGTDFFSHARVCV